jgi:SET domain-containing protein
MFAVIPIRRGSRIAEYTGKFINGSKKINHTYTRYVFELDKEHAIDGAPKSNKARYINHACYPNAEPIVYPRLRRIFIVAKRRIHAGEEITYNYGREYFDIFIGKRHCRCKSCRKRRSKRGQIHRQGHVQQRQ